MDKLPLIVCKILIVGLFAIDIITAIGLFVYFTCIGNIIVGVGIMALLFLLAVLGLQFFID